MDLDGDNLYTIPMTSTGYVRRDVKQAMYKTNLKNLRNILPRSEERRVGKEC